MILIRRLPLLFFLAIAGCQVVSPNEVRNNPATFSGTSRHAPEVVSQCIYDGWSATRVIAKDNTSHLEKSGNRITVYTWGDSLFADVYSVGKKSEVKFFQTFRMNETVLASREAVVKGCL